MYNKQRGVNATEKFCKIGKVTKIEVSTSLDKAFDNPIDQLEKLFKGFGDSI